MTNINGIEIKAVKNIAWKEGYGQVYAKSVEMAYTDKILKYENRGECIMRYYISDLHFYHENLNSSMDCRGFTNYEEMNEHMIMKWNEKVRRQDEVVILGDLSIAKGKDTNEIIKRLNGQYRRNANGNPKVYMLNGHVHNSKDQKRMERFIAETSVEVNEATGCEIEEYIPCNMINCFCMFSDYTPLHWMSGLILIK